MALALTRLEPNRQEVAAEIVDGVAILINLSTGVYYNLEHSAGAIWALIEQQRSVPEIVAALIEAYDVTPEQASGDVERLVTQLIEEGLVLHVTDAQPQASSDVPDGASVSGVAKQPYQTPQLDIFRDMSPLLAHDPPVLVSSGNDAPSGDH